MTANISKITILVDNYAENGFGAEHGLSIWIEHENRHILFDTGQKNTFGKNAERLDIDIAQMDALVLSHGHFDHTGGIPYAISLSPKANVYCHPLLSIPGTPFGWRSKAHSNASGIQVCLDRVAAAQLHWVKDPVFLSEHLGITGVIARATEYEDTGGPSFLTRKEDGKILSKMIWLSGFERPGGLLSVSDVHTRDW